MGRHEADDGAARHPLVEEALHRRPPDAAHGAHEASPLPGRPGPIGWPGADPDRGGEPVGWPNGPEHEQGTAAAERGGAAPRGWRRLLGRPSAA